MSPVKRDETVPASLIPGVRTVNGRRGRVDIFSHAAQGHTLRELIIAGQDTGHWSVAGTPEQIAGAIADRFNAGVLDVVSLGGIADNRQHEFVADGLLHELRKRGIVNDGYRGTTLRETSACRSRIASPPACRFPACRQAPALLPVRARGHPGNVWYIAE